jgi:hypothetical protein
MFFFKFCNKGAWWWFEWTETCRALSCCVGLHTSSAFQQISRRSEARTRTDTHTHTHTYILGSGNGFGKVNCMKPLLGVVGGRARGNKTKQTLRLTTQLHRCRQPRRISHRYDKVQELALLHLLEKLETQGLPVQTSVFVCSFGFSQRVGNVIQLQFLISLTTNVFFSKACLWFCLSCICMYKHRGVVANGWPVLRPSRAAECKGRQKWGGGGMNTLNDKISFSALNKF